VANFSIINLLQCFPQTAWRRAAHFSTSGYHQ